MKRRTALTAILSFFAPVPAPVTPVFQVVGNFRYGRGFSLPHGLHIHELYHQFYTTTYPNVIDLHTEIPLSKLRLT